MSNSSAADRYKLTLPGFEDMEVEGVNRQPAAWALVRNDEGAEFMVHPSTLEPLLPEEPPNGLYINDDGHVFQRFYNTVYEASMWHLLRPSGTASSNPLRWAAVVKNGWHKGLKPLVPVESYENLANPVVIGGVSGKIWVERDEGSSRNIGLRPEEAYRLGCALIAKAMERGVPATGPGAS